MTGQAINERRKKIANRHRVNANYKEAVDEYLREQQKPPGKDRLGLERIAGKWPGVTYGKLRRMVNGEQTMEDFNAKKRALTASEESVLLNLLEESAKRGFPLVHKQLKQSAERIIEKRPVNGNGKHRKLGKNWVYRFIDVHSDRLHTFWSSPLATERANGLNPTSTSDWFDKVHKHVVARGVEPHNIYGMDESGFPPANSGRQRVIGRKGSKSAPKTGGANSENVTGLITICADGTALRSTVVFKGKNLMMKWGDGNVSNASISVSENGWTDGGICLKWMEKDFDPQTRSKANGEERLLFIDGHSSHYTLELLEYCREHNITLLAYPPHCTHALQGLDVVCFAKMKHEWKVAINEFEERTQRNVKKDDFCAVFGPAFLRAFTPESIKAAFRVTGIHPFDRTVISEEQMKPSERTSTKASFPLAQNSPTRAVLRAFQSRDFTTQDLQGESSAAGATRMQASLVSPTHSQQSASTPQRSTSLTLHSLPSSPFPIDPRLRNLEPLTPKRKRQIESEANDTPSKRMRLLGHELAQTSSASCLLTKPKLSHFELTRLTTQPTLESMPDELEEPDWSLERPPATLANMSKEDLIELVHNQSSNLFKAHARDATYQAITEGQNAQLVVQNLAMIRMNQAVHEKEKKGVEKQVMFPDGLGRHLTADEVVEQKRRMVQRAKEEEQKKESRNARKEDMRRRKKEVEEEWQKINEAHDRSIARWAKTCEMLAKEGKKKKDLPRKPKRAPKPKLTIVDEDEGDEDMEVDDEDDL